MNNNNNTQKRNIELGTYAAIISETIKSGKHYTPIIWGEIHNVNVTCDDVALPVEIPDAEYCINIQLSGRLNTFIKEWFARYTYEQIPVSITNGFLGRELYFNITTTEKTMHIVISAIDNIFRVLADDIQARPHRSIEKWPLTIDALFLSDGDWKIVDDLDIFPAYIMHCVIPSGVEVMQLNAHHESGVIMIVRHDLDWYYRKVLNGLETGKVSHKAGLIKYGISEILIADSVALALVVEFPKAPSGTDYPNRPIDGFCKMCSEITANGNT